jgi:WD40 repeat protein
VSASDRSVKLWEVDSGRCLLTFEVSSEQGMRRVQLSDAEIAEYVLQQYSLEYTENDRLFESAQRMFTDKGFEARRLRLHPVHSGSVQSVALSPDGRLILTASNDTTARLWEAATGKCLDVLMGHEEAVGVACFSPDGRLAVTGSEDKRVRVWDVATGRCLHTFTGHVDRVRAVSWSADGRLILSGGSAFSLKLWEVGSGRWLASLDNSGGRGEIVRNGPTSCLSADGRHALAATGSSFRMWDLGTGHCLREFGGHQRGVRVLVLSADGRYALSAAADGTLRLWLLDWELEPRLLADWDDGAQPYLELFLNLHTPWEFVTDWERLTDEEPRDPPQPSWTEQDFRHLLDLLGSVGYGWLRPEGVRRRLPQPAARSAPQSAPPPFLGLQEACPARPVRPGGWRGWLARLFGRE